MWTPPAFSDKRFNAPFGKSPFLTPKDWRMIKARRVTGSAPISINQRFVTSFAPQVASGRINQPPSKPTGKLSIRSACWTVLCIYVGLGLLSKPYAVAKGGWVSIAILAFFTCLANFSGKMLVNCFDTAQCRNATTYADVVDRALGYWGAIFLIVVVSTEFFGGLCISIIFIWRNLETLMPSVPSFWIRVTSTVVSLPTMWLIKLADVSWLTLLGFISSVLVVVILVFVRIYYGKLEDVDLSNSFGSNIPLSLGIYMVSLAGHAALPQVYREMSDPSKFNLVMNISFLTIFIIYAGTGVVGYLIYGSLSDIVISTNLIKNPGGVFPKITTGFIITKNFLTLNPFVTVLCDSSEVMMGIEESRVKQRLFRSFVFLSAAAISYVASDALPFIESITGAIFSMFSSFIIPALVFAFLKKELKSLRIRFKSGFILFFGFVAMGFSSYGAIESLLHPDIKN